MKKIRKMKKYLAILLVVIVSMGNSSMVSKAEEFEPKVLTPVIKLAENLDIIKAKAGETITLLIPVQATNYRAREPVMSTKTLPEELKVTSKFELYKSDNADVNNLTSTKNIEIYGTYYVKFDVKVSDTAKLGDYTFSLSFATTDNYGDYCEVDLKGKITIRVTETKAPASISISDASTDSDLTSGTNFNVRLTLKNNGEINASKVKVSLSGFTDDGIQPNYTSNSFDAGSIAGDGTSVVNIPLTVSSTATSGKKAIVATMTYKDSDGNKVTDESTFYLKVIKSTVNTPGVVVDNASYPDKLKAGTEFNLVLSLKNKGAAKAKTVKVMITEGFSTEGFIPNYTSEQISAGSISANGKTSVKVPMIVSKTATVGVKTLALKIIYTDSSGNEYTETSNIYLEVSAADGVSVEGKPNLVISSVTQSPSSPNAGGNVSVTFTIENKSNVDIKEMKISATNLTNANFSPLESEPYIYIESLKAGKKKQLTMRFSVSETVTEGLNEVDISLAYKDTKGQEYTDTAKIYVIDVVNELGSTKQSKPKLIISDFSTGEEDLRAGSVFTFKFDINNTHSSLSANNIKVTISSAENVFSIINGSNSFYIESIKPGETLEKEVQLKIKSDSVTKAYPIDIKFEYDYEGLEKVTTENGVSDSVEVTETLNLPVVENARPVVNNIVVGDYDVPTVNMPTVLSFEFYNMGRSTLNNVMARIEGDFAASSNMVYIGNVEAGSSDMQQFDVTPTIEGQSSGTLIISYEDSNGDTIDVEFPFEAFVQGEVPIDDSFPGDMTDTIVPEAKQPIVKTWIFVLIQAAILGLGIPLSRKAVLGLYKRKLRKKEEEEF